jgi:hypothetical protein
MVNANIDIFEISYEESVSYFKRLENLEKISHTNGPNPSSIPVDNKKSVISSVGKFFNDLKASNMWCHYCDKNNHNIAGCRALPISNSRKWRALKPKMDTERSLWTFFCFSKKLMHSKDS